jgi:nucleoside-diphosphate-sugar epimerase
MGQRVVRLITPRHRAHAGCFGARASRGSCSSTIDVFTWRSGETYDESEIDPTPKGTHYERSKQRADKLVVDSGLDAVFLHPSAVYGTGPSDSPGVNDLIVRLANNKAPGLLPGGFPVVFAPDVGEAQVRAAERAPAGARYILSDRYYTLASSRSTSSPSSASIASRRACCRAGCAR